MVEDTEGALGKTKESPVRKGKREDKGKEKEKEKETQRHKERKGIFCSSSRFLVNYLCSRGI